MTNGPGGMDGFPGGMHFTTNMGGAGGAGGMAFDPNEIFKMFFSNNMEDGGGFGSFMNAGGGRGGRGGAQGFSGFGGMPGFANMSSGAKKGGGRGRGGTSSFQFGQM